MASLFEQNTYLDYRWNGGRPEGISPVQGDAAHQEGTVYKITSDPYHKRIQVERYEKGVFAAIDYDNALFDFRWVDVAAQGGWEKQWFSETECWIRNVDDRVILSESYTFDGDLCLRCEARSPHGVLVSVQAMNYTSRNDDFDGVVLYDATGRVVMEKRYCVGPDGQFTTLISSSY